MNILVLGKDGQVGQCLRDQLADSEHNVTFTSRDEIDITNFALTRKRIIEINPQVVINASAYTAVDDSENNYELANEVNHLALDNLAKTMNDINSSIIHISTDYVFDGNSRIPYTENSITNPKGVYGKTKLLGELALKRSECSFIIIRTAWVYSEYGNNFLKTMIKLARERENLSIVDDQMGRPTYAQDLAKIIVFILNAKGLKAFNNEIYHYGGDSECSWFEFAEFIFSEAKKRGIKIPKHLHPIKTSEYKTLARRPMYSSLDSNKIIDDFGVKSSNYRKGVEKALRILSNK